VLVAVVSAKPEPSSVKAATVILGAKRKAPVPI
jgi:hypothetical protein